MRKAPIFPVPPLPCPGGETKTAPLASTVPGNLRTIVDRRMGEQVLIDAIRKVKNKAEIKSIFSNDPWQLNFALNWWEYINRIDVLESYPWNIALPIADLCNARCTFCNSWLSGKKVLSSDQLERYVEPMRYARLIGFQGHGEPLANPSIDKILRRIHEVTDPRAQSYIITNGVFLKRRLQALVDARVTVYNFSLNAATNATHNVVMGLGEKALDTILEGIRDIVKLRDEVDHRIQVTISLVITADNLHEVADFVRLGNDLGVSRIYLRSLMPIQQKPSGLNYHLLSPVLHPNFDALKNEALSAIARSKVPIEAQPETWHLDALTPSLRTAIEASGAAPISREDALKDQDIRAQYSEDRQRVVGKGRFIAPTDFGGRNPYGRRAPFDCRFIYQQLITTTMTFRAVPCCYMTEVPGHESVVLDGDLPFMDYWNSEAFVALRRSLRDGPLYGACRTCPMQG